MTWRCLISWRDRYNDGVRRALAAVIELFPRRGATPRTLQPALDDAELLAAIARGDAAASTALYRRARPPVERTVLRILGRHDRDHDDLIQSSLIEVIRSMPAFRSECSLDTWIKRIAARTVYRTLRRRQVERRVFSSEDEVDLVSADDEGTDTRVGAKELVARLRRHLDAIEESKAWAVVLHDVCGYDLREIADIMACSVSAAQSRLVRGRTELNERLERDPELAERLHPDRRTR